MRKSPPPQPLDAVYRSLDLVSPGEVCAIPGVLKALALLGGIEKVCLDDHLPVPIIDLRAHWIPIGTDFEPPVYWMRGTIETWARKTLSTEP